MGKSVKTPWNPSRSAIKRVKNPLPEPTVCPHCGSGVSIYTHKEVYGRNYSDWPWLYKCSGCDAQVGMYPFTGIPLGTLATREMRHARNHCKQSFQLFIATSGLSRTEAYEQLAMALGIEKEQCHFGWFNVEMCYRAKHASLALMKQYSTPGR